MLLEDDAVSAAVKTPTTAGRDDRHHARPATRSCEQAAAARDAHAAMIGTTHFTNAVVQRRDLGRVAAVRIGLPAGASLPPFVDWPEDLAALVRGEVVMLEGGHEFDGRPLVPFDARGMRAAARRIRDAGIRSVGDRRGLLAAERRLREEAAAILREECPDVAVTLSHRLGRIGLLERENATLLNACLIEPGADDDPRVQPGAGRERHHGSALPDPERRHRDAGGDAERTRSTASRRVRPTRMRGAAFLSGRDEALVIDVGGTTTDIGSLRHGFPREANNVVEVGGVRTLFRMPDLLSLGLGGGTHDRRRRAPGSGRPASAIGCTDRRSCSAATTSPPPTSPSPPA